MWRLSLDLRAVSVVCQNFQHPTPTDTMVYAKSEITPNEALEQSTEQERKATLARLREGDSKIDAAT